MSAAEIVDEALARARSAHERYTLRPLAALNFALGVTGVGRDWGGGGWPEVLAAARGGDAVAVELLCRRVELSEHI